MASRRTALVVGQTSAASTIRNNRYDTPGVLYLGWLNEAKGGHTALAQLVVMGNR